MRKINLKLFPVIIGAVVLSFCLLINSCTKKSSGNPVSSNNSQTPAGEIGSDGGTVTSIDSSIRLKIPSGALSSPQAITINISNDSLPEGFCAEYNFSPNGLKFNSPATLTIHYTDSLLAGMNPLNAGIAYQDDQGNWFGVGGGKVDTVAHTFSVPVSHFSKWGIYRAYFISREKVVTNQTTILTNSSTLFNVFKAGIVIQDDAGPTPLTRTPVSPDQWLVNGIIGGSSDAGTIDPSPNIGEAIFTSPAKMPGSDPVAVSAEIILSDLSKLYLICSTEILAKHWRYEHIYNSGFQCESGWSCHFTYGDTVEIDFQLGDNFQVSEWLPGPHFYSLSDVGVCDPNWSISVKTGNPQEVMGFSGGYDAVSGLITLNVKMTEADSYGFDIYIGNQKEHQDVQPGMSYTDPVVFPPKSYNTYIISDKDKGYPRFDEYTWILSQNDNP